MAKQSKKSTTSSFFSKLIPRSSKAKLIVFLLAFTVIGGGYMAYQSYAATTYSFNLSQAFEPATSANFSAYGNVSAVTESSGAKKDMKVVSMTSATDKAASVMVKNKTFPVGDYEICATVKSTDNTARFWLGLVPPTGGKGGDPFSNGGGLTSTTGEYKKVCSIIHSFGNYVPMIMVGRGSARVGILAVTPLSGDGKTFTVTAAAGSLVGRDGATVVTETSGSKKSQKVVKVPDVLNASATLNSANETTSNELRTFVERNKGKEVRMCALMRANKEVTAQVYTPVTGIGWEFIPVKPANNGSYQYICSKYSLLQTTQVGYAIPEVRIANRQTSNYLHVWGLILESR